MTATQPATDIPSWQFDRYVEAEADGTATAEQLAALEADRARWQHTLWTFLKDAEAAVAGVRSSGASAQIVMDLESELRTLSDAWGRLTGEVEEEEWDDDDDEDDEP